LTPGQIASIEPDFGRPDHKGVRSKSWVLRCVIDDERPVFGQREIAKCHAALSFRKIQTCGGLEPLSIAVHQRDYPNRDVKEFTCKPNQRIQCSIARSVQDHQASQHFNALRLVLRNRIIGPRLHTLQIV
jgi:hypothetical protein